MNSNNISHKISRDNSMNAEIYHKKSPQITKEIFCFPIISVPVTSICFPIISVPVTSIFYQLKCGHVLRDVAELNHFVLHEFFLSMVSVSAGEWIARHTLNRDSQESHSRCQPAYSTA